MKKLTALTLSALALAAFSNGAHAKPKYGPDAAPLSSRTNVEYFQKNPAPDFWTLIPFYLPQPTGSACSAMNLMLVLNGARSATPLTSDDKLLTVEEFLKTCTDKSYENTILRKGKFDRANVTSKNLARLLKQASDKLKLTTPKTEVKLVVLDFKNLQKSKKEFLDALKENEKSSDDYIILSGFIQGTLTGDPDGPAHVATVGAYDEKKGLVLVLDPDREWYEPYWSPVEKVWDAIRDPKSDGISPSWIYYRAR